MDRKIIDDLEHEACESERLEPAPPVKEQADNLLEEKERNSGILVDPNSLGQIVAEIISPVMKTIGKLLENNTAALEQLSSAQSVQNDRLEALEKQIRLQTLVTSKQVYYLNDAIRMRARELLDKRSVGQYTRHCPQFTHWVSAIFLLNAGITIASVPRYAKFNAPIP